MGEIKENPKALKKLAAALADERNIPYHTALRMVKAQDNELKESDDER